MATYKNLVDVVQGKQETTAQYMSRIYYWADNNYLWATKRLKNESAEDHFDRFAKLEASDDWGDYLVMPRIGEDWLTSEFVIRCQIFYRMKADLYRSLTSEVINSMNQVPGEPLGDWLTRVEGLLYLYHPIIYNHRTDIYESEDDRISRILIFANVRNRILAEIKSEGKATPMRAALQTSKLKFDDIAELEAEKERKKLEQRFLDDQRRTALDEAECKASSKKQDNKIKYGQFVKIILVAVACIFIWFSDKIVFDWTSVAIMAGSILLISILLGCKKTKTKVETSSHYHSMMDLELKRYNHYKKEEK